MISTKPSCFKIEETVSLKNNLICSKFINWIIGEFDLFLKEENSKVLKVYFPNGSFSIDCFQDIEVAAAIKVEGKSKVICEEIMNQIMKIYKHVYDFHNNENSLY